MQAAELLVCLWGIEKGKDHCRKIIYVFHTHNSHALFIGGGSRTRHWCGRGRPKGQAGCFFSFSSHFVLFLSICLSCHILAFLFFFFFSILYKFICVFVCFCLQDALHIIHPCHECLSLLILFLWKKNQGNLIMCFSQFHFMWLKVIINDMWCVLCLVYLFIQINCIQRKTNFSYLFMMFLLLFYSLSFFPLPAHKLFCN